MTAKEYLSQIQKLQTIIEQKQEQIKEIRESVSTVRAVRFDLEKVQGGGQTDRIGDSVVRIVDLEKELESDMLKLLDRQHEVINQIQRLDDCRCMSLLFKRYIMGKSFQIIANEMNFTYRHCLNLHEKALNAFEEVNKENVAG